MRILFLFYFCGMILQRGHSYSHQHCTADNHEVWLCNYMRKHNRTYSSSAEMNLRRSKLLTSTKTHGQVSFGLTSRSDRFVHELKRNVPLILSSHRTVTRSYGNVHKHKTSHNLPPIDWRNHNGNSYVTPVKDQGDCGDCFAFASATVLEYWSKKHGHPKSLSSQKIMDCTSGPSRPDVGCDGGLMEYVFEYAKNHPIGLEAQFPYKEAQGTCPQQFITNVKVKQYKVLMHDDNPKTEQQFEAILHKYGPISIGIDSTTMDNYKDGIFTADLCSTDIDHAVTIIGYTKDAWIIKNSWGPYWGRDGYLYLERGKNACGVAEYAVYVSSAVPAHERQTTKWHMEAV